MRVLSRLIICIVTLCLSPTIHAEELVEGIAATVTIKSRNPIQALIFYTDLERFRIFFEPSLEKASQSEKLNAVIHDRLFRAEARRFILDEPSPEAVLTELKRIRARFEDDVAFQEALRQTGLILEEFKQEIREVLWVKALLDERVREFIFISPKAIKTYYREHEADFHGKALDRVEADIEAILIKKKEDLKKKEYLQRLKSNAEIHIFLK